MFPNMDGLVLALERIFELIERGVIAIERIADSLDNGEGAARRRDVPDPDGGRSATVEHAP
jgi:hypothetical protein